MGKKKQTSSDKIRAKKKGSKLNKFNPFEVKVNKQKHRILGKKRTKSEHGNPGVSRSKADKKRKNTLLQEYKERHKANKLIDKRIGEKDATISLEEKMMKRYALERKNEDKKGSVFSLNDEEDLTHYGQSLSNIEKFDNPEVSDDDGDDDEDVRRLRAKIVAEEHFGGFLTKKADDGQKTFKEKMDEVVALSKKYKYERQNDKNERLEMTEKADKEYTELMYVLAGLNKSKSGVEKEVIPHKPDDYDIAVRTLQFEVKGKATDRLKTDEEIAKETKERLETMEADRIRRMKGIVDDDDDENNTSRRHISADDLHDGFNLNIDNKDRQRAKQSVHYREGVLVGGDDVMGQEDNKDEDEEEEESDDNNSTEDDNDEDDNNDNDNDDDNNDNDEDVNDDDDNDDNDDEDDDYSDLASDNEEAQDTIVVQPKLKSILKKSGKIAEKTLKIKDTKEIMEKAKKELPFTFPAPTSYDEWLNIIHNISSNDQIVIIDRIQKLYHPSLAEGNKHKLETFLEVLVQYFGDLALQDEPEIELINRLIQPIYSLTKMSPDKAAEVFQNEVMSRQEEFRQITERKHGRGLYLGLDLLLILKMISVIFPTSDFQHKVTTPSLLLMTHMLSQTPVNTGRDVIYGLFLSTLCLEYVSLSKRFIPEVFNFLHGVLFLSIIKQPNKIEKVFPPFKPVGDNINLLIMKPANISHLVCGKLDSIKLLSNAASPDMFKTNQVRLNIISTTVELLKGFSELYTDLPSYKEIYENIADIISKLPISDYPAQLQQNISELQTSLQSKFEKPKKALQIQKNKPIPLRMFEPQVEEKWTGKSKKIGGTKEFQNRQKLQHKHKREMKGAVRDIRRDSQFLARHQLKETIEKDSERKRKVKALYSSLANQEGEVRALKKGKQL